MEAAKEVRFTLRRRRGRGRHEPIIRQEVAKLRNHPANIRAALRCEFDAFVENFSTGLAQDTDPRVGVQVNRLAGLARDALAKDDRHSIEDARRSFDEVRAIIFNDLAKKPGFWIGMFEDLANERHRAIDKEKHDQYVRDGEDAIKREEFDRIRQAAFALRNNMVHAPAVSRIDVLAGLMR
jgi:hypothetical protein